MSNLPPILPPVPGSLDDAGDKNRIDKLNQLAKAKRDQLAGSEPFISSSQKAFISTPDPTVSSQAYEAPNMSSPLDYSQPFDQTPSTPDLKPTIEPTSTNVPIASPIPNSQYQSPTKSGIPISLPPLVSRPPIAKPPVIKPYLPPRVASDPGRIIASAPQIASQPVAIPSNPNIVPSEPVSISQVESIHNSNMFPEIYNPSASAKTFNGWAEVATELKRVLDYAANTVIRLAIENQGLLTIDPKHQVYQWNASLANFPTTVGKVILDPRKVEDNEPAIPTQPGSEIGDILWLIGHNAFNGSRAAWLNENERYKLQKWPNLTSLGVGMEVVLISATLGNTPSTAEEIAVSGGVSKEEAHNIINALSLMGLLSVHPNQGKGNRFKGILGNKNSLFNRLRKRWGR